MKNLKAEIKIHRLGINMSQEFDLGMVTLSWGEQYGERDSIPLDTFLSNLIDRIKSLENDLSDLVSNMEKRSSHTQNPAKGRLRDG